MIQNALVVGVALTASLISNPYAATCTSQPASSYVETGYSSSMEGEFTKFYNTLEVRSNNNPPIIKDAISIIGEIDDLTEEEVQIYHNNILKHAKFVGGSYFD